MAATGSSDLEELIERRRALGIDRFDEVWEGEYRVNPGPHPHHGQVDAALIQVLGPRAHAAGLISLTTFNLGEVDDYRVPDQGYVRATSRDSYLSTAAVVVEVLPPGDDTYGKFDFYAAHGVEEIIVASPDEHWIKIYALDDDLDGGRYRQVARSSILGVDAETLTATVSWP